MSRRKDLDEARSWLRTAFGPIETATFGTMRASFLVEKIEEFVRAIIRDERGSDT